MLDNTRAEDSHPATAWPKMSLGVAAEEEVIADCDEEAAMAPARMVGIRLITYVKPAEGRLGVPSCWA